MSITTKIQWCDSTCNPTMGCEGCELWNPKTGERSCYAGVLHLRYGGVTKGYSPTFDEVTYWPGRMAAAAKWRDLAGAARSDKPWLDGLPRLIFVSDMSDALSAVVPFTFLEEEIVRTVTSTDGRRHHWLWLTKRPDRMAEFSDVLRAKGMDWPENLWAGTSVTTQPTTSRVKHLIRVGDEHTIRFLSVEPQRGKIDLGEWLPRLNWIIQGGESGSGARPFHLEWALDLICQCKNAGVAYFLKQLGSAVYSEHQRLCFRHGHAGDWSEWPEHVRIRQMPGRIVQKAQSAGLCHTNGVKASTNNRFSLEVVEAVSTGRQAAKKAWQVPGENERKELGEAARKAWRARRGNGRDGAEGVPGQANSSPAAASTLRLWQSKGMAMSKPNDRDHFEGYRAQTRVKHEILAAYLAPYFRIVGKTNTNLLYVDGFAGPGRYKKVGTDEVFDGSPLLALKLIAGDGTFANKATAVFFEADQYLYDQLDNAVTAFAASNTHIRKPRATHCTFEEGIRDLLASVNGNLAPTFLFVDPCGVSGTSFEAIKRVVACASSEAFIFFNIDGVRRIAGLDRVSNVLVELLGSPERATKLFAALQATADVGKRERLILECYREALRVDMGVKFTIPFRVESEERQTTSHYLIHATNHPLGFKIMKEVMWTRGQSDTGLGDLQFVQASRTDYIPLFDPRYDVKAEIRKVLAAGPVCVDLFYLEWVVRPHDLLCQPAYKQALLELEASGEVLVLDKDRRTPKPRTNRRPYKGKPTLGEGYYVRLSE